jgi:hypothetical protein
MSGEIKCICGQQYPPRFHNTCPNCGVDSSFAAPTLLAAVKEIEWCVDTLKQHRQHWMMTKNLNVLPSDGQCKILIKTLEKASEILKAANSDYPEQLSR